MRPSPRLILEQVGRHWAANTLLDGGLLFVEPTDATPGNVYAAPLPRRAERLSPACSLTLGAAPAASNTAAHTVIGVVATAHAATPALALAMLNDLRALLRPGERAFIKPIAEAVIGRPELEPDETFDGWRIVTFEIGAEPQPLNAGQAPDATAEGEAAASMAFAALATPHTWTEPGA